MLWPEPQSETRRKTRRAYVATLAMDDGAMTTRLTTVAALFELPQPAVRNWNDRLRQGLAATKAPCLHDQVTCGGLASYRFGNRERRG